MAKVEKLLGRRMDNYEFCATYIKKHSGGKSIKVLDYGCGAGQIVAKLIKFGIDAYGCDIFYKGADYSAQVPLCFFGSIIKRMENGLIPFQSESFDFVVNNQVIEHINDIDHALNEMHRVLKPGGQMLSLFPHKGVWLEVHCGIPFLHWFPKGAQSRVYYAALLRRMGLGYHKGTKSIWQWSREFCEWLDQWTWYHSRAEIEASFSKYFKNLTTIEDIWLKERFGQRALIVKWLPKRICQLAVRNLAGLVFVCTPK